MIAYVLRADQRLSLCYLYSYSYPYLPLEHARRAVGGDCALYVGTKDIAFAQSPVTFLSGEE